MSSGVPRGLRGPPREHADLGFVVHDKDRLGHVGRLAAGDGAPALGGHRPLLPERRIRSRMARQERLEDHLLVHERIRAAVEAMGPGRRLRDRAHEDDPRLRQFLPDAPRQLDPVEVGHDQSR